jgi:ABC-type dipeptide/oligopeptide/nickel transport system ATPase component
MGKQVDIKLGDHFAVLGATGTGKTVAIRELINTLILATDGYMPIYILDTKAPIADPNMSDFKEFFRPGIGTRHTGDKIPKPIKPRGKNFCQVWTPEEDVMENYNEYFKQIYQAGTPAVVLVDELSSVSSSRGDITRYHNILMKQGRGLSISMINLTQSPAYIGQSIIRQAMHVMRFRLNDNYDSKKLNGVMGKVVEEEPQDTYGFWYRNVTIPVRKAPATYYEDMQEFFGLER